MALGTIRNNLIMQMLLILRNEEFFKTQLLVAVALKTDNLNKYLELYAKYY